LLRLLVLIGILRHDIGCERTQECGQIVIVLPEVIA